MAILRKIRNKLAKMKDKKQRLNALAQDAAAAGGRREHFNQGPGVIEQAKFYTPEAPHERPRHEDLPAGYGWDKIILQVRDPWWIHAYWELRQETVERLKHELKDEFQKATFILRVYDVSYIIFNGDNAHRFFDIHISSHANNWYIDTGSPGRSWCVDLGLKLASGRFITIIRSNTVQTPLAGPSWITDEEWMIPEDMFARLYGMGVGFGSSPLKIKSLWEERLKSQITSGAISSLSSPVKKIEGKKDFWLAVNTELIVYGATEPDAQVTVQGRGIKLRPDGTFTLRFALPDARQVIPVKAVSSDSCQERTITPIVSKETR